MMTKVRFQPEEKVCIAEDGLQKSLAEVKGVDLVT